MKTKTYTLLCPFGGLGAGALGFLRASTHLMDHEASFRLIGGIDFDPAACADFEYLTGVPELCADVHTMTAEQIVAAFGATAPDVVFMSPPCKGASGLLPSEKAKEPKYRKLNRLALVWTRLMLEAWAKRPPRLVLLENVPMITTRAKRVLDAVKAALRKAGYVLHEGTHDCGELGGLAQHRKRYLLVARHQASVTSLLYKPVEKRVRACGEVLGSLPMPNDPRGGDMHVMPKIGWVNWVRLAMIPAGGDHRDIEGVLAEGQARREVFKRHAVEQWDEPVGVVGGSGSNAVSNVADPRVAAHAYNEHLGVLGWDESSGTVTGGAAVARGRFAVADPRVQAGNPNVHDGKLEVRSWSEPAGTVTGATRPGSGAQSVADPRLPKAFGNVLRVVAWNDPTGCVTTSPSPSSGGIVVADPRVTENAYRDAYGVSSWDEPAATVIGAERIDNSRASIADPRFTTSPDWNNGQQYGVVSWGEPASTVAAGSHPGQGKYSVADPRLEALNLVGFIQLDDAMRTLVPIGAPEIPAPFALVRGESDGAPVLIVHNPKRAPDVPPVIIAKDGTWHRPLTTLELAVLQGLPAVHNGKPLVLFGTSSDAWRERIGNAVPVQTAQAIAEQMLLTLLSSDLQAWGLSSAGGVWVAPDVAVLQ